MNSMDIAERVENFYAAYTGEKGILGKSVCGNPVYAMFAGKHEYPQLIVQGAIHAREWITAGILLEQIRRGFSRGGAWFLPMTNPDGVLLASRGEDFLKKLQKSRIRFLLSINGGSEFQMWKANANGVDLNVNFASGWGSGVKNIRMPAAENYIGKRAFSEPETRILRNFTQDVAPDATLSYHTKGEEIYWEYGQQGETLARDRRLGEVLEKATGYRLKTICGSGGGYKDWCIERLKIPAFTIEAGSDLWRHPLGEERLALLAEQNGSAARKLASAMYTEG